MVASKTPLLVFSGNFKIKYIFKERVLALCLNSFCLFKMVNSFWEVWVDSSLSKVKHRVEFLLLFINKT